MTHRYTINIKISKSILATTFSLIDTNENLNIKGVFNKKTGKVNKKVWQNLYGKLCSALSETDMHELMEHLSIEEFLCFTENVAHQIIESAQNYNPWFGSPIESLKQDEILYAILNAVDEIRPTIDIDKLKGRMPKELRDSYQSYDKTTQENVDQFMCYLVRKHMEQNGIDNIADIDELDLEILLEKAVSLPNEAIDSMLNPTHEQVVEVDYLKSVMANVEGLSAIYDNCSPSTQSNIDHFMCYLVRKHMEQNGIDNIADIDELDLEILLEKAVSLPNEAIDSMLNPTHEQINAVLSETASITGTSRTASPAESLGSTVELETGSTRTASPAESLGSSGSTIDLELETGSTRTASPAESLGSSGSTIDLELETGSTRTASPSDNLQKGFKPVHTLAESQHRHKTATLESAQTLA